MKQYALLLLLGSISSIKVKDWDNVDVGSYNEDTPDGYDSIVDEVVNGLKKEPAAP